ncbi:MAG: energy transducer TonB [Bryobacteraceae bacterium]
MGFRAVGLWLVAASVFGQETKAPNLKRKVEPTYTEEARENGVQGKITEIELISPLGYGLDEQAKTALEQWEFEPGRKNGVAVDVDATVEVRAKKAGRIEPEKIPAGDVCGGDVESGGGEWTEG